MADPDGLPAPRPDWALFLDVDGTLVEIADTPEGVQPDATLPGILSALREELNGAIALISGRPLSALDAFFAPVRLPAGGLHGLERRRADGQVMRPAAPPDAIIEARHRLIAFAESRPGLLIEDKGLTVALHYRRAQNWAAEAIAFATAIVDELDQGLILQRGKMVVEIRPSGPDKGSVIEQFMTEKPFAGRVPVFAGDDLTDEAGFNAVNRMGGHSIRVGSGESAAKARIPSVTHLLAWLRGIEEDLAKPTASDTPTPKAPT